jgi:hypothetical protein
MQFPSVLENSIREAIVEMKGEDSFTGGMGNNKEVVQA